MHLLSCFLSQPYSRFSLSPDAFLSPPLCMLDGLHRFCPQVMNVIFVECRGGEICHHSSCSTCNALCWSMHLLALHVVFTTWMLLFLCIVVWGLYFTDSILQVWSRWRSNRSCGCRCPLWRPQCWPFIDLFSGKAMGQPAGGISCLFFGCKGEVTNIYVQSWATIVTVMMFS